MYQTIKSYVTILFLLFSLTNCLTTETYKLSEILPARSQFEGESLDPLLDRPVEKPSSKIPKYDEYLEKAKRIIVKIRFVSKFLKTNPDKLELNLVERSNLFMEFAADLPKLKVEINALLEQGKQLSSDAKKDFMGTNIMRLPNLLTDLSVTIKDLGNLSGEITDLIANLDSSEHNTSQSTNTTKETSAENGRKPNLPEGNSISDSRTKTITAKNDLQKSDIDFSNSIPDYSNSKMTEERLKLGLEKLTVFQTYLSSRKKN